jgi:N-acetylglutamate synthase-like GNAT family acetyltransferase
VLKNEDINFEINFFNHNSFLEIIINEFGEPFNIQKYSYSKEKAINENNFTGAGLKLIKELADDFVFINHGKLGKEFRIIKNIEQKHARELEYNKKDDIFEEKLYFKKVTEDDSEDIAKLIYRTYSYTYPKEDLYYPEKISKLILKEKKIGVIAKNINNIPCGYFAIIKSPYSNIGEVGEAVVSPNYRGKVIITVMMTMLINIAKEKGMEALFGEATTVHLISQKVNFKFDFKSTAICYAIYPKTESKGFQVKQYRISVVFEFLILKNLKELELYIPKEYKTIIKSIYNNLGIKIKDKKIRKNYNEDIKTDIRIEINYKYNFAVIIIYNIGKDFIERIENKINSLKSKKSIEAIFVDMPLDNPLSKVYTESIRRNGFIFSGILPLFYKGKHYFRLQWSRKEINFKDINLFSKTAKKIKNFVNKDLKWITSYQKNI